MEIRPCPECGQSAQLMVHIETCPFQGDIYRCPVCRSIWYGDELDEIARKETPMYDTPNPNVDKYQQMKEMIAVLLPGYIYQFPGTEEKAASVIKEFEDMEQARATIVGVDDTVTATMEYLNHHFQGTKKPEWYANLTES